MTYDSTESGFVAHVYRVFIAGPGDIAAEKREAERIIFEWTRANAEGYKVVLIPKTWESDAPPSHIGDGQEVINTFVLDQCDLLIAVFHSRLGFPTARAEAGTVEEMNRFIGAGKPTLLYFSQAPLPHNVDIEQLERLRQFKKKYERLERRGLYRTFENTNHFASLLAEHITKTLRQHGMLNRGEDKRGIGLDIARIQEIKEDLRVGNTER